MLTVSFSLKFVVSILNADFNNGNLFGISIEPEMSTRKTRLDGGNESRFSFFEKIFIKKSWLSLFHGQFVSVVFILNSELSLGDS